MGRSLPAGGRRGRAGRCQICYRDSFPWALRHRAIPSCLVPGSGVTRLWGDGVLAQGESQQRRWWVRALGWVLCV